MKKILLITITIFIAFSCKKDEPTFIFNYYSEGSMYVKVLDTNGVNLLDQNNPNGIKENQIRLYEFVDGVKTLFFTQYNKDMPYCFEINEFNKYHKPTPESALNDWNMFMGLSISECVQTMTEEICYDEVFGINSRTSTSRTLIEWSKNDVDTIKVQYIHPGGNRWMYGVWVNDELMWDRRRDEATMRASSVIYTKIIK